MKTVTVVINIMADGVICKDISTYLSPEHALPELAKRRMIEMIREGRAIRDKADK